MSFINLVGSIHDAFAWANNMDNSKQPCSLHKQNPTKTDKEEEELCEIEWSFGGDILHGFEIVFEFWFVVTRMSWAKCMTGNLHRSEYRHYTMNMDNNSRRCSLQSENQIQFHWVVASQSTNMSLYLRNSFVDFVSTSFHMPRHRHLVWFEQRFCEQKKIDFFPNDLFGEDERCW